MSDFFSKSGHKAFKARICSLCGGIITVGERYQRWVGTYTDGHFYHDALHRECADLISQYLWRYGADGWSPDDIADYIDTCVCDGCNAKKFDICDRTLSDMLVCPIVRKNMEIGRT